MTPVSNALIIGFRSWFFPLSLCPLLKECIFDLVILRPAVVPAIKWACNYPVVYEVQFFDPELARRLRAKDISK